MRTEQLENNLILGEQQRLYHLLQEADSLSRQLELKIYSEEDFDASIIQDVSNIKNIIFCNLIKEGFYFDYINTGNYNHDSLHMLIENVSYSCPLLEAQKILGDKFKEFCSEVPMIIKQAVTETTSDSKAQEEKTPDVIELENKIEELAKQFRELSTFAENNKESSPTQTISNDNNEDVKNYIKQLENKISSLSKKVEMESTANRQEFQILSENHAQSMADLTNSLYETMAEKQADITKRVESVIDTTKADLVKQVEEKANIKVEQPKPIHTKTYVQEDAKIGFEKNKHRNSFLYDEINVEVMDPYGHPSDHFKVVVTPLTVGYNDNHVNIMVSIEGHNEKICAVSGQTTPINITFRDTNMLIRGLFSEGDFKSLIIAAGETATLGYKLNLDTIYHRPSIENFNYGHICFEYDDITFHICPIQDENNNKQVAVFVCCLEKDDKRYAFLSNEMSTTNIQTSDFQYRLLAYWKDNFLYCEVLPC